VTTALAAYFLMRENPSSSPIAPGSVAEANPTPAPSPFPRTDFATPATASENGTPEASVPIAPANAETKNPPSTAATPSPAVEPPLKMKKGHQDRGARIALEFVGVDPVAEEYWLKAINDPNLSADERKDLIEDLNEDGISNPSKPTAKDLPLIVSRIELIEKLAPSAIDKANADAFKEAHKDLVNMYQRLTQR
jgi:hypothetical protein